MKKTEKNDLVKSQFIDSYPMLTSILAAVILIGACGQDKSATSVSSDDRIQPYHDTNTGQMPLSEEQNQILQSQQLSLSFSTQKLKNTKGQICFSVFDKPGPFPNDASQAVTSGCVAIKAKSDKITINRLKQNTDYAIAIFHDENSNSKLDTRKILDKDAPKEGFGFSRNPGLTGFGPPPFNKVKMSFSQPNAEISIELLYLF